MTAHLTPTHTPEGLPAITLAVFVPGKAEPEGNLTSTRHGKLRHTNAAVLYPWRERVALTVRSIMNRNHMTPVPRGFAVSIDAVFALPRIKSLPKLKADPPHTTKPDLDKLIRAIGDALEGPVYDQDSQIHRWIDPHKRYARLGEPPGVSLKITSTWWCHP